MAQFHIFKVLATIVTLSGLVKSELITSPPITNWGVWGDLENCPPGRYAQGFQIISETWIGPVFDDTSLNGIILYCGDPFEPGTVAISSSVGSWGRARNLYRCGPGDYITGFQLRVELGSAIDFDETATNNVRFYCGGNTTNYIEADGETWGSWREARHCPVGQYVCGIQTQVQPNRGPLLDDTALNNVALDCCPAPQPTLPTTLEPETEAPTTVTSTTQSVPNPTTTDPNTTGGPTGDTESDEQQPTSTPIIPQCPPTSDIPIYFPALYSCDHYYMCSNGSPILMKCALTLWWAQSISQCVPQGSVPCTFSTTAPILNY